VIACFPVYRTYIRPTTQEVRDEDRRQILAAVRAARRRNLAMSPTLLDFLASVLLLKYPEGLAEEARRERLQFVLKFQQVTGPVMAKGLEDTALYRWHPLVSVNEVGGDPSQPGATAARFDRASAERLAQWPHAMLATANWPPDRGSPGR